MGRRVESAFAEQGGPVGPTLLVFAGIWGLVTVVLLFALLGAVDDTESNADDITANMTQITRETEQVSLATALNGTAKEILRAVEPLEPSLARTNASADQLEGITEGLLRDVATIQAASGTTLASVESASRTASSIEATSEEIARFAAAIRASSEVTAGKAGQAGSNLAFTQALSNSIETQILTIVKDIDGVARHVRRNDARGGQPGP